LRSRQQQYKSHFLSDSSSQSRLEVVQKETVSSPAGASGRRTSLPRRRAVCQPDLTVRGQIPFVSDLASPTTLRTTVQRYAQTTRFCPARLPLGSPGPPKLHQEPVSPCAQQRADTRGYPLTASSPSLPAAWQLEVRQLYQFLSRAMPLFWGYIDEFGRNSWRLPPGGTLTSTAMKLM